MKKLFAILILLMYGFSSTGMTISMHYCCGKLKSIEWAVPKHKSCNHKQKMGGKPCCETKLVTYKNKTDHNASGYVLKPVLPVFVEPNYFVAPKTASRQISHLIPEVFAPPPLSFIPLYISFGVFRI